MKSAHPKPAMAKRLFCAAAAFMLFVVFIFFQSGVSYSLADDSGGNADETVYLVWKESGFSADSQYVLSDNDGDGIFTYVFETTQPRYLSYCIETAGEKYYPNGDGVVYLEKAGVCIIRYAQTAEFGGSRTEAALIDRYYFMSADNGYTEGVQNALKRNIDNRDYEEYALVLSLEQSENYEYYIHDILDGGKYYPSDGHNVEIAEAGDFRVFFSPGHAYYTDENDVQYFTKIEEYIAEKYYVFCKDNDFKQDDRFLLEKGGNEEFTEYVFDFDVDAETSFAYFIFAAVSEVKYFPNKDGVLRLEEAGDYRIKFSPYNVYFTDGDRTEYYTEAVLIDSEDTEYEHYLLSVFNGFSVDDAFKLEANTENERFSEYVYSFTTDTVIDFAYHILRREAGVENGINYYPDADGVVELEPGDYDVLFSYEHVYSTIDSVNYYTAIVLRDGGEKIVYYVLCAENDYKVADEYALIKNEENNSFDEYLYYFSTTEEDAVFAYYIYEPSSDVKYYPNKYGAEVLADIDDYTVRFSLSQSYFAEDNMQYYTCIELTVTDYEGYFLIGNINGYRYLQTVEFASKYMLTEILSGVQEGYDYRLEIDITDNLIKKYGKIEYFITDGETRFRGAGGNNIVLTEPGLYEIYFASPGDDGIANVYHLATKKYNSIQPVSELQVVDGDNNFVYIRGEGFTSDMQAKLIKRGKYSFLEITRDGKIVNFDSVTIIYYAGTSAAECTVSYYIDKKAVLADTEISGQYLIFELNDGVGFVLENNEKGLSAVDVALIVGGAAFAVLIATSVIISVVKRAIAKKAGQPPV